MGSTLIHDKNLLELSSNSFVVRYVLSSYFNLLVLNFQYAKSSKFWYADFLFFFNLRKISPELTTANSPLFAEEDWPWANMGAHLPLLYMWDAYHSMACQAVPCLHLGSEQANPGPPRSRTCALNCCATGPAPDSPFSELWAGDLAGEATVTAEHPHRE